MGETKRSVPYTDGRIAFSILKRIVMGETRAQVSAR